MPSIEMAPYTAGERITTAKLALVNATKRTSLTYCVRRPSRVFGKVTSISGGNHHTVAVTDGGACLTWGRVGTNALGLSVDSLAEYDIIRDAHEKPRILMNATQVPGISAVHAAAGSDHCVAVTYEGNAYSWGFGDVGWRWGTVQRLGWEGVSTTPRRLVSCTATWLYTRHEFIIRTIDLS